MKHIITIFLLLSLTSSVYADTISDINVAVSDNGFTNVEERIIFEGEGDYGILVAPEYADGLSVSDENGNLTYSYTEINGINTLKINFKTLPTGQKTRDVWLKYGTHYLTYKDGDSWTLKLNTPSTPRKTIMRVALPPGATLVSLGPEGALRTYVKEGVWVYPQENTFNLTVTYKHSGIKYPVTPPTTAVKKIGPSPFTVDAKLIYGLVLVVVVLVMVYVLYTLYKHRQILNLKGGTKQPVTVNVIDDVVAQSKVVDGKVSYDLETASRVRGPKRVKDSVLKMLDENELSIIRLLENSEEEEVTQAYIYKTTGIPKSSLSDILKHIEKRNIVERRTDGRVKWIKFKSWVLD